MNPSPSIHLAARRHFRKGDRGRAFTLVEVLAAMLLIAIVLPAVMGGIQMATQAASTSRHRNEAAGLGQAKLAEIIATNQWQNGNLSGDFTPDWPDYHWQATIQPWAYDSSGKNLQQVDLRVTWTAHNQEQSITLSSLAYERSAVIGG